MAAGRGPAPGAGSARRDLEHLAGEGCGDGAGPDVTIEKDTAAADLHRVLLDGEVIAEVTSDTDLTLSHLTLIPRATG